MFFGGHTVTLGNVNSDIGLVSMVVLMGLSDQLQKALLIDSKLFEQERVHSDFFIPTILSKLNELQTLLASYLLGVMVD